MSRLVDVLIAGAGPTGLALALWLAQSGVRIRTVDKVATPGTTSRAFVVHARTLEFYRQLGIADAMVDAAIRFDAVNLWVRGRHAERMNLGPIGAGATASPFMLIFPQDEHERLLIERLRTSTRACSTTYETERIAFAKRLVATTDRAFQLVNIDRVHDLLGREIRALAVRSSAARSL